MELYSGLSRHKPIKRTKSEYTQDDFKRIRKYHDKMVEIDNGGRTVIDDITWNDLEMDKIFAKLNSTVSTVGEEYLYHMLRCPAYTTKELEGFNELKSYFRDNADKRALVKKQLEKMNTTKKFSLTDSLYNCLNQKPESNLVHYILDLLICVSLVMIFVVPSWGTLAFIMILAAGILTYFKVRAHADSYVLSLVYVLLMLSTAQSISGIKDEELGKTSETLKRIVIKFKKFSRNTFVLSTALHTTENPLELLLDYVRMIFHVDIIKCNSMLKMAQEHMADIEVLRRTLGKLDSAISIVEFEIENASEYTRPLLYEEGQAKIDIADAFHPLLEKPVRLSVVANKGVLVTGSNASGKSTFLKTVAICAILAQTVNIVPADRYRGSFFRIFSSMALRDSISQAESYYIVEIKSLKRILDESRGNSGEKKKPILCFIDEVLRGTNTVERIAASSEILSGLNSDGVLTFAATHDIELTYILENEYTNYHFKETVDGNDIKFDYILHSGRSNSRNAIKLLSMIGYDREVVDKAENRAREFLTSGKWI